MEAKVHCFLHIHVFPEERRSIVKPQQGNICFAISPFQDSCSSPQKEKYSNPQWGKAKRNPREEPP